MAELAVFTSEGDVFGYTVNGTELGQYSNCADPEGLPHCYGAPLKLESLGMPGGARSGGIRNSSSALLMPQAL